MRQYPVKSIQIEINRATSCLFCHRAALRVFANLHLTASDGPLAAKLSTLEARYGAEARYEAEQTLIWGRSSSAESRTTFIMASFGRGNGLF